MVKSTSKNSQEYFEKEALPGTKIPARAQSRLSSPAATALGPFLPLSLAAFAGPCSDRGRSCHRTLAWALCSLSTVFCPCFKASSCLFNFYLLISSFRENFLSHFPNLKSLSFVIYFFLSFLTFIPVCNYVIISVVVR